MPSSRPPAPASPPLAWRRRLAAGVVVAALAAAAIVLPSGAGTTASRMRSAPRSAAHVVTVSAGGRIVLRLSIPPGRRLAATVVRRRLLDRLPRGATASRGRARIVYRYDLAATVRRAVAAESTGGRVEAPRHAVASRIPAPVIRQAQRNTCESAALQILLAGTGADVSQQRLQRAFPRSGSPDPQGSGADRIWGDPDRGYVGRGNGGGVAGGFGVYPRPVAATARRFGRKLDDLTGSEPARLYRRLLRGRAVMAWIGLSDGPYGEWRSPQGRRVRVNFGEHTIVLAGVTRAGGLRVVNPLSGTSETWSRGRFEAAWKLLGRRALGA